MAYVADVKAAEDGRGYIPMPQPPWKVGPLLALFEYGLCVVVEGQPAIDDGLEILVAANPLHNLSVECQLWNTDDHLHSHVVDETGSMAGLLFPGIDNYLVLSMLRIKFFLLHKPTSCTTSYL